VRRYGSHERYNFSEAGKKLGVKVFFGPVRFVMRESSTMSVPRIFASDEWQLGPEPEAGQESERPTNAQPPADLSAARLGRPVKVVTVEHLAWGALAIWAVITRFLEVSVAPLAPAEARHALFEYDLVNRTDWASASGYHPAGAGWIHLLEAGLFAAGGVSDFVTRLMFVLAGLLIIFAAFLMRPYLGRAGAIAVAGLIATSPTFTFFSRTSATPIVAAALAMVVIDALMAVTQRPSLLGAAGLGCASGLLCAVDAGGLALGGILLVAFALLGVYQLIVSDRVYLNVRIWLERYASLVAAAILAAAVFWFASEMSLFRLADVAKNVATVWTGMSVQNYLPGLLYYAPGIMLYEFLIILAGITGLIVIISLRAWSRLALFCLLWLVLTWGYFLGSHQRDSERLVLILLPLVIVGALGIDYFHHTSTWPYARAVLVTLGAATVYVQVAVNFIHAAPEANEAPWARPANLYWREGATTIEARARLSEIRRGFPEAGGSVFNAGIWQPSLRWYLRDFRPTNSAKLADLVINRDLRSAAGHNSGLESLSRIDLEESWEPTLATLTPAYAIRFVFTATAWAPLQHSTIAITVRPPSDVAPTLVIPPPASH
jgi:predicted membrane-bound mannosyltransferase